MKNKTLLCALAAAGVSLPVFAEGTPAYESAATQVQTALTTALGSLAPMVTAVVVAGVAIWLVPRAVRLVKSAFSAGAGR